MKRLLLIALILFAPCTSWAAQHSDDWCADAVDFAMRTALYHGLGDKYAELSSNLDKQAIVFRQQYPRLSTQDMHRLIDRAFKHNWTHFTAAVAISSNCRDTHAQPPRQAEQLTIGHSDEWCADAVDYVMVTAENRKFGYTVDMLNKSVRKSPYFYKTMFPKLTTDNLVYLNEAVYKGKWSRFGAAHAVSSTCRVAE